MLIASLTGNAAIAFTGLCLGACIQGAVPLLYSFPSQHFPGARGAVALALVNSIGNIGGFEFTKIQHLSVAWPEE